MSNQNTVKRDFIVSYKINYGNKVAVFPESVMNKLQSAGPDELKVLLCLCARQGDVDVSELASLTGCSSDEVKEALSFWRGAGIIEVARGKKSEGKSDNEKISDGAKEVSAEVTEPARAETKRSDVLLKRQDELPQYTSTELADILESRREAITLIEECQKIMGKVFNVREINILIGLSDYLGLDCEYIMILLTYCVSIGKKTLHYAEKTAFSLYEMGICDAEALSEELKRRENIAETEGKIRSMFGIGARAFTTKEKKLISAWINDMKYSVEIIARAYEVTADATGAGSIPYANSVLERWNAEGLRTLEEIEKSYKKSVGAKKNEGSFDTDAFFEAAVKRSLGE